MKQLFKTLGGSTFFFERCNFIQHNLSTKDIVGDLPVPRLKTAEMRKGEKTDQNNRISRAVSQHIKAIAHLTFEIVLLYIFPSRPTHEVYVVM
jgi:hypothetical protein